MTTDVLAKVRLHQLEGFFHVAKHQGYTRAAGAMDYPITEPALHQQVRKLEKALGARLLERAPGRRMVTTPAGRALFEFIEPYFDRLPGVLRSLAAGNAGTLVVVCESLYVAPLAAPALAAVANDNPNAQVALHERDPDVMAADLLHGRADVGLVAQLGASVPGLRFDALGSLRVLLLAPQAHSLCKKRTPPTLAKLAQLPLIVYSEGTEARRYTEQVLATTTLATNVAAQASSAATMQALVRGGVGVALVPAVPIRDTASEHWTSHSDAIACLDLTPQLASLTELPVFGLLQRGGYATSPLVEAFEQAAKGLLAKP